MCDLEDERQVPFAEGKNWAESEGIQFYETSAKARIHVEDIFIEAARRCLRKKNIANNRCNIAPSKKKKDCCIS